MSRRRRRDRDTRDEGARNNSPPDNRSDLTHLLDDRVELLQQMFSSIRPRELRAMLPDCIKHLPLSSIKELCLEELLGISSKRLLSWLRGESVPADTDSSSDEQRASVSLESISSNEDHFTASTSKKKQRKHKKHSKKLVSWKGRKKGGGTLTVLELIELQARARAIRAQLLAERQPPNREASSTSVVHELSADEDDEVFIKEEPPEVVELSSGDDEKPNIAAPEKSSQKVTKSEKEEGKEISSNPTEIPETPESPNISNIIKRNDLTIIYPKPQSSKGIKLKRDTFVPKAAENTKREEKIPEDKPDMQKQSVEEENPIDCGKLEDSINSSSVRANAESTKNPNPPPTTTKPTERSKYKIKRKRKTRSKYSGYKSSTMDDSDKDEIMLQLSDTEKMDLLEDFYAKKEEKPSSSNTEDSDITISEEETPAQDLEKKDLQPKEQQTVEKKSMETVDSIIEKEQALATNKHVEKNLEQQIKAAKKNDDIKVEESKETLAANKSHITEKSYEPVSNTDVKYDEETIVKCEFKDEFMVTSNIAVAEEKPKIVTVEEQIDNASGLSTKCGVETEFMDIANNTLTENAQNKEKQPDIDSSSTKCELVTELMDTTYNIVAKEETNNEIIEKQVDNESGLSTKCEVETELMDTTNIVEEEDAPDDKSIEKQVDDNLSAIWDVEIELMDTTSIIDEEDAVEKVEAQIGKIGESLLNQSEVKAATDSASEKDVEKGKDVDNGDAKTTGTTELSSEATNNDESRPKAANVSRKRKNMEDDYDGKCKNNCTY